MANRLGLGEVVPMEPAAAARPALRSRALRPRGPIVNAAAAVRRLAPMAIFPLTMSAFMAYGVYALNHGLPPDLLSPTAVPVFILWMVFLERFHPYCRTWSSDQG